MLQKCLLEDATLHVWVLIFCALCVVIFCNKKGERRPHQNWCCKQMAKTTIYKTTNEQFSFYRSAVTTMGFKPDSH